MPMEPAPRPARESLVFETALAPLEAPAWLAPELQAMGVELEPGDDQKLGQFLAILLAANERLNLTAIKQPEDAWRKHIFDALTLIPLLAHLPEGSRVADVGSGGGVPAIPLAIACPSLRFTLVEATGKKASFLEQVSAALGLTNVEVIADRAETLGQNFHTGGQREAFDAVMARALGKLNVAAELTVPLAKLGGHVLLVKGEKLDEELAEGKRALALLGAEHAQTIATPTGRIAVLEKVKRTPRSYPRPAGEPKRKPL